MKAILLCAHGARDPAWAEPLQRMLEAMRAMRPGVRVELGFLEHLRPTFDEAVERLADAGHIVVVPAFIAAGSHLKRDLPQLAAAAMDRHPGLMIELSPPVGESPEVVAAIADFALRQ